MVDGTGDGWRCEGLKSVNDRRGPVGDVAEGVCNAGGGVKAAVLTDASVVDADGGVIDVQELVVLPDDGCEAGSAGAERGTVEADAGVTGDMLEAAEDVVEPVCALVEVADDANALVEVAVAVNTEAEDVGVLPEAVNVLLVDVDTLPEVVGAAGAPRDPASCPPPPCDGTGSRWSSAWSSAIRKMCCACQRCNVKFCDSGLFTKWLGPRPGSRGKRFRGRDGASVGIFRLCALGPTRE
ncbi:uncharacterized protein IUM83_18151 [Phytophthora cinnamomi]|uniref:uncharacterized protein n=1 Tax=Phytophthora cinnamomi TaxID=4785 RepID=UPI00355A341F|nr:hypothetical protein IUM83_18151 [Phytophthora cinnamomi]